METVFSSVYCVIAAGCASGTSSGPLRERPARQVVRLDNYLLDKPVHAWMVIGDLYEALASLFEMTFTSLWRLVLLLLHLFLRSVAYYPY
jgi:hypothetical protein